jgi:hypothetical protein
VVERQQLGDESGRRDPGHVRGRDSEPVEHADGVGDEIAQGVVGVIGIDGRRAPGVALVVADDEAPGQLVDERVGPGGGGGADQQHRWIGRVPRRLDSQLDLARTHRHAVWTAAAVRTHRSP